MITRVIRQLQQALHKPSAFYFSDSGKFKNKGRPEKGSFFGRNKNKEQKKQIPQQSNTQAHQNKPFKTAKFLHKKQNIETGSQSQKIPTNNVQTQPIKIEQTQKVEQIPVKLRKQVSQQPVETPQTQPTVQEQEPEQTLADSIIEANKRENQGKIKLASGAEVVQKQILTPFAFKQFAQDSQKVLQLFDNKQWSELQATLKSYESQHLTPQKIVNTIHPLFINKQPVKYAQWVSHNKNIISHLSDKLMRKVFNNLLNSNQYEAVRNWTTVLQSKDVDIGYQFLDSIFSLIDKNASLSTLRATIPPKIQMALFLLDHVSTSKPSRPKYNPITLMGQSEGYMVGTWLSNLWYIAKQRYLFMTQFIQIFQQLTIKHKKRICLVQMHANGLFLDVVQNYYFGSHISSQKLNALFSHIFGKNDFKLFMTSFRTILMQYKVRTGKAPFPKINNFYEQLRESLLLSQYHKALFYFQLCIVQGEEEPFQIFEDNPKLIKTISFETNIDILKDGLLCVDKQGLESKPSKSKKEKKRHHTSKIISNNKANQIQSFFSRNTDNQQLSHMVGLVGLNKQHIDILANRDQTSVDSQDINRDKLREGNQQLYNDQDEEYYLSQNDDENDQYVQMLKEVKQIGKTVDGLKRVLLQEQGSQQNLSSSQQLYAKDGESNQQGQYEYGYSEQSSDPEYNYPTHPYVRNMAQFYKNQLKNQCFSEKNFLRKELLKVLRLSSDPLNETKAAIKLGKPEYAWTVFKHKIMRPLIKTRMLKNIDYVIRAYILEHSKTTHEFDIHQIIDSLHRFKYEYLDQVDTEVAQNEKQYHQLKNTSFAQSIYEKLQNFDHLVWENLPQGKLKHQFWESTLVMERAEQLLRLEARGTLDQMQYEREYFEIQNKKVDQLFPKQLSWRDQLIYGLGISQPEQVPIKGEESNPGLYLKFEDQLQFKEYILNPLMEKHCPPVQLRTAQQHSEIEGQVAQGEQVAAEGEQVQAEGQQVQAAEGEQVQAGEGQQQVAAQAEEGAQVQAQQAVQAGQAEQSAQTAASAEELQAEKVEQTQVNAEEQSATATDAQLNAELMAKDKSIFEYSQQNKVKGYDFEAFMQINKLRLKPFFQKEYEENQKPFKKYFLALQALVEEAYLYDNHSLQKKLVDVQSYIKDPYTIAKMTAFGLWNFDFVTVRQPLQYLQRSSEFIENFYTFKKYMGDKLPEDIPNLSKQKIQSYNEIIHNRRVTHQLVEQLLMKRHHLFKEAEAIVRIDEQQSVEQIILWGLFNDEPLAVYMGEKLAMITNQKIPHKLALLVARYFSHRREVPESRVERCKQALKIVGRINREHIYELSKDYQHITVRKHLKSYMEKRQAQLDSSALNHLTRVEPTYSNQDTTFNLKNKISRGNLTI